jgi:hypothetical protein
MPELHKQMLEVLGVKNIGNILPSEEEIKPMDPVSENMNLLVGKPVKAFIYQDHDAHIATHMSMGHDPKIQSVMQNNPSAQNILAATMAHVNEHMAFMYRRQIEEQLGVALPPPDTKLPEEVEVQISRLVAQASAQLVQKNMAEAQQAQEAQNAQDPLNIIQREELNLRARDLDLKAEKQSAELELAEQELELKRLSLVDKQRESKDRQVAEGFKFGVDAAERQVGRNKERK